MVQRGLFLRQVESLKTGEPKVNYREQGPTVPRVGMVETTHISFHFLGEHQQAADSFWDTCRKKDIVFVLSSNEVLFVVSILRTITSKTTYDYTHKRQSGGRGQYGKARTSCSWHQTVCQMEGWVNGMPDLDVGYLQIFQLSLTHFFLHIGPHAISVWQLPWFVV